MPATRGKTPRPLRRFLIRTNCEYSLEVEARDADEAMSMADKIDVGEWNQAWASVEAEKNE